MNYALWKRGLSLSQTKDFRFFQTERVYRRQFQIWWKWIKVLWTGWKHCGKSRKCSSRVVSLFATVFSKHLYCWLVKPRLVWERVLIHCKWTSLNTFVLHRLRNKFLKLILISLDSASWELHKYSRRMCGPIKILKLTLAPGNRTQDLKIARPRLYLTTTDTTRKWIDPYQLEQRPKLFFMPNCNCRC